jgi:putative transposase
VEYVASVGLIAPPPFNLTIPNHGLPVFPNLTKDLTVTAINQLWVADITYTQLPRGFVYLAVLLDAFSRRLMGWALERHLMTELPLAALQMALDTREVKPRSHSSL